MQTRFWIRDATVCIQKIWKPADRRPWTFWVIIKSRCEENDWLNGGASRL